MLKTSLRTLMISSALIALPAFAQMNAPASAPATTAAPMTTSVKYVTTADSSAWRASKLVGVDVYGTDNAKIGDINEVLLDKDGMVKTVVIGVGGFLGIGEKDVAVDFKALEWKMEAMVKTTTTTNTGAANTNAANNNAARAPATTTTTTMAADRGYPDHAVLRATKDELKNAPEFKWSTASTTRAPATTTTAPAPAPAR